MLYVVGVFFEPLRPGEAQWLYLGLEGWGEWFWATSLKCPLVLTVEGVSLLLLVSSLCCPYTFSLMTPGATWQHQAFLNLAGFVNRIHQLWWYKMALTFTNI